MWIYIPLSLAIWLLGVYSTYESLAELMVTNPITVSIIAQTFLTLIERTVIKEHFSILSGTEQKINLALGLLTLLVDITITSYGVWVMLGSQESTIYYIIALVVGAFVATSPEGFFTLGIRGLGRGRGRGIREMLGE